MPVNKYRRTRADHSRESAEDYVELIEALTKEHGEARAVDLAERLGVSHVTVLKTVQRLKKEGLVSSEPYRSIFLTKKGTSLAEETRSRHVLVRDFLVSLGIPNDVAETDAEGIEHHVSKETLSAMKRYLEKR